MEKAMGKAAIRIITPDFGLAGEIKDHESLQFTRRFYTSGEFELHINVNKKNTDALIKNNLIMLGTHKNKVGIIRHRENEVDQNGEATDTLIIKGPTLKGVCAQPIIVPPTSDTTGYDSCSGAQETIMKHFVDVSLVNPANTARKIAQVAIAADQQRGTQDKWRFRWDNLADALAQIGEYAKLGWDMVLDIDNRKWVFDVLRGRDLTTSQSVLPPVFFSADLGNISKPHFIQSWLNCATVGYAGGKGDGADRLVQEVGSASGLDRIEKFLDCTDAEDVTELLSLGSQKLADAAPTQTFTFSITDPDKPFRYGTDYDLGDTVTAISRKWGIKMDVQITQVKEIYESSGCSIEPTFGTNIPTLLGYIKNKTHGTVR